MDLRVRSGPWLFSWTNFSLGSGERAFQRIEGAVELVGWGTCEPDDDPAHWSVAGSLPVGSERLQPDAEGRRDRHQVGLCRVAGLDRRTTCRPAGTPTGTTPGSAAAWSSESLRLRYQARARRRCLSNDPLSSIAARVSCSRAPGACPPSPRASSTGSTSAAGRASQPRRTAGASTLLAVRAYTTWSESSPCRAATDRRSYLNSPS